MHLDDHKVSRYPQRQSRAIIRVGRIPGKARPSITRRKTPHPRSSVVAVILVVTLTMATGFTAVSVCRDDMPDGQRRGSAIESGGVGQLRVGVIDSTVSTMNPLMFTLEIDFMTVWPCYSTLLMYDVDGQVIGDLADSWDSNPEWTIWHFELASNAYFVTPSNPTDLSHPVTASDVVFSFWTVQNYTTCHLNKYLRMGDGSPLIVSMWAPTDHEIFINTTASYTPVLKAFTVIPILPEYIWSAVNPTSYSNLPLVGSGPFYYPLNTKPTAFSELRRNPVWYHETNQGWHINVEKLLYMYYSEASYAWMDLNSTDPQIDVMLDVPRTNFLDDVPGHQDVIGWGHNWGFVYEFNMNQLSDEMRAELGLMGTNNQLLRDPVVKEAMQMAVDKQTFVSEVLLGLGTVGDSLVPDTNPWHYAYGLHWSEDPVLGRAPLGEEPYEFNTTSARQELMDAGWAFDSLGNPATATTVPLCKKGALNDTVYHPLSFRMYSLVPETEWAMGTSLITEDMAAAGVLLHGDAEADPPKLMQVTQMHSVWYTADYDCWLWDWLFSPLSEVSADVLSVLTTMGIGSRSDVFWSNATFDDLYNQSLSATDPATRMALTDEMQRTAYVHSGSDAVAYRSRLFAASEVYWTNYGNWTEQFMLIPTYGAPWLYMQVTPPDTTPPVADAGDDQVVMGGMNVTLDGSDSSDDVGVVSYVWNFTYDGSDVVLTGIVVSFVFMIEGAYDITLNVTDVAGNSDTDVVRITVSGMIPELSAPALTVIGMVALMASFVRWSRVKRKR